MQLFTGSQYLEIDIATNYGLDKSTWVQRLAWFDDNRTFIESDDMANVIKFSKNAKDPYLFVAGVLAYRDMLNGQPIGYMIGLDATASGLQLLSCLIACPLSAALCNVLSSGFCLDAYTGVYQACQNKGMINKNIPRKALKYALMTHLYGSKAVPKQVFGDGEDLQTFYAAVNELLPGANMLNHALLSLWDSETLAHCWTLPDGFDVKVKVMVNQETEFKFLGHTMVSTTKINAPMESGLSIGANIVHSVDGMVVREMLRRCSYDSSCLDKVTYAIACNHQGARTDRKKDLDLLRLMVMWEESGFLSAHILDLLDPENVGHLSSQDQDAVRRLMDQLPDFRFDLVAIHDCFRCHPNYGNDLRQQYINILAEITESNMLASIAGQLLGKHVTIPKIDPNMHKLVRQAEYAIS